MTRLGPHAVTIAFTGGPDDGTSEPYRRDDGPMPDYIRDQYRLHHVVNDGHRVIWAYRWEHTHTGLRQPCRAGDERGCPGSRCPSHRQRQPA